VWDHPYLLTGPKKVQLFNKISITSSLNLCRSPTNSFSFSPGGEESLQPVIQLSEQMLVSAAVNGAKKAKKGSNSNPDDLISQVKYELLTSLQAWAHRTDRRCRMVIKLRKSLDDFRSEEAGLVTTSAFISRYVRRIEKVMVYINF
jgi:hypothetical protein